MTTNPGTLIDRRDFLRGAAASALAIGGLDAWPRAWAADARPFGLLIIGDSILWGQGLQEESKFTTRVAQWIGQQLPGTRGFVRRYAHSGAVIAADDREDAKAPKPGEIPTGYPSITAQLFTAASHIPADQPIDLVLMDGGINDVAVTTILTTDPTVSNKVEWIRRLTRERCAVRMERLLPFVLQKFPAAKVVCTAYYPIVSVRSELPLLTRLLRTYGIPDPVTAYLRSRLSDQSLAFHEEYVSQVRPVVLNARPLEVIASAVMGQPSGARLKATTEPSAELPGPGRLASGRTAFVVVPFAPETSYGAPATWLWKVAEEDQVATTRRHQCLAAGVPSALMPQCYGAAMGHPNVTGAEQYALAVQRVLERFLPEWRLTFARRVTAPS